MTKLDLWTVVQHSAWAWHNDRQFQLGLEEKSVTNATERAAVVKAGGILFETHEAASDYAHAEMYPDPSYQGLTPRAKGTFRGSIGDLPIYVPSDEEVKRSLLALLTDLDES